MSVRKLPEKLSKTTIIIWSEYDGGTVEIADLARDATSGDAYCSLQKSVWVDPRLDGDFDGTDFFGFDGDDDGEEQDPEA